jgi:hypothetical protein
MGGACDRYGASREAYRDLLGLPERKTQFGRSRHICKDNIKMDLEEVGWGTWIGLIWFKIGTGGELL